MRDRNHQNYDTDQGRPYLPETHDGRRGHRGGRGPGFGSGHGPGPGPGSGGHGGRGRRGGRGRGDVRTAILGLLAERPRHGYELIQDIAERSSGSWTPSPGSIYPNLQALEDEGMISIAEVDGRKTASLTDAGRAWVNDNVQATEAVFATTTGEDGVIALLAEMRGLAQAVTQMGRVGTPAQQAAAAEAVTQARKAVYRVLADDAL